MTASLGGPHQIVPNHNQEGRAVSKTCDLHTHTTASDGQYTPAELAGLAKARGLSVLAVTDHDTIAGVAEAQRAGTSENTKSWTFSGKRAWTLTSPRWRRLRGAGRRPWPTPIRWGCRTGSWRS